MAAAGPPDGDVALAVQAMQAGAEGFLTKPVELAHLGAVVDRAYVAAQRDELARLAEVARAAHAEGRPAADVARELPYFGEYAPDAVSRAYSQLTAAGT